MNTLENALKREELEARRLHHKRIKAGAGNQPHPLKKQAERYEASKHTRHKVHILKIKSDELGEAPKLWGWPKHASVEVEVQQVLEREEAMRQHVLAAGVEMEGEVLQPGGGEEGQP